MTRAGWLRAVCGFGVVGAGVAGLGWSGHGASMVTEIPADVLARSEVARLNMQRIVGALAAYANEWEGAFPPDLTSLYPAFVSDPMVFWHPGDSDPPPVTINNNEPNQPNSARISFEYAALATGYSCLGAAILWDNSPANNGGLFINKAGLGGFIETDPPFVTPTPTRREVAQRNLGWIAQALRAYANTNRGYYPSDLLRLWEARLVCLPRVFWNPGDSDPVPTAITNSVPNAANSAQISYSWFGGDGGSSRSVRVVLQDVSVYSN